MKIVFIGHSHHQQTKSSEFFLKILRNLGEVVCFWDETWKGGAFVEIETDNALQADLLIVWQMDHYVQKFASIHRNVMFVPMYDSSMSQPSSFWESLKGCKILAFSGAIHERATRAKLPSLRVQYFPDPTEITTVSDWSALRGFFWQRNDKISWNQVKQLIRESHFSHFTLHGALDPVGNAQHILPTTEECAQFHLQTTGWFKDKAEFMAEVASANVNFAPRTDEGIGMSFLEGMALGQLVVAPNRPTMNEYISHGLNGLLYEHTRPHSLNFGDAERIGMRARRSVERGHREWLRMIPEIISFTKTPPELLAQSNSMHDRRIEVGMPASMKNLHDGIAESLGSRSGGLRACGKIKRDTVARPLVSVATVVYNGAEVLGATMQSVFQQTYDNIEYLVIDGGSSDGTIDLIKQHEDKLDLWISEKDKGPYDAMNKAARLASGRWIIFMNAGDAFFSRHAIANAVEDAPYDSDFIIGHHVYRSVDGTEFYTRSADFEETWRILVSGKLTDSWKHGIPCHQATFTRTNLLGNHGFDLNYRITADHDFMYRMRSCGSKFHHSDSYVSFYNGGGLSAKNQLKCIEEWQHVALKFSKNKKAIKGFYEKRLNDVKISAVAKGDWAHAIRLGVQVPSLFSSAIKRASGPNPVKRALATLRNKKIITIDFTRNHPLANARSIQGVSFYEGWGVWTAAKNILINFKENICGNCEITLHVVHVFGPCSGNPIEIRVGDHSAELIPQKPGRLTCQFKLEAPCDTLMIHIPSAISPHELGCGDERRALGLGLASIEVEMNLR